MTPVFSDQVGWDSRRDELKEGARHALKMARECLRDKDKFDADWCEHMLSEAHRHRERARWYLERRQIRMEGMAYQDFIKRLEQSAA